MTDVSASSSVSAILNSYTKSNTALTKKTKEALQALNVDTTNIKTEADGETALAVAKRNAAVKAVANAKNAAANASTSAVKDSSLTNDDAVEYESSVNSTSATEE